MPVNRKRKRGCARPTISRINKTFKIEPNEKKLELVEKYQGPTMFESSQENRGNVKNFQIVDSLEIIRQNKKE